VTLDVNSKTASLGFVKNFATENYHSPRKPAFQSRKNKIESRTVIRLGKFSSTPPE
jgi:hypothetical protein